MGSGAATARMGTSGFRLLLHLLLALQSCLSKKGQSSTTTFVDISTMSTHQQRCAVTLLQKRMCAAREREHQPPQPVTAAPSLNLGSNVGKFNLRGRVSAEAAKMRPQVP